MGSRFLVSATTRGFSSPRGKRCSRGAPWSLPATHLLVLCLQQGDLLLHLTDMAGGLGYFGPLQVTLSQQLLNVLLLLLQRFLQGCRA